VATNPCQQAMGVCFEQLYWLTAETSQIDASGGTDAQNQAESQYFRAQSKWPDKVKYKSCYDSNLAPAQITDIDWEDVVDSSDGPNERCVWMAGASTVEVPSGSQQINTQCLSSSIGSGTCVNFRPFFVPDLGSYWHVDFYGGVEGPCGGESLCDNSSEPVCDTASVVATYPGWCGDAEHYLSGTCQTGKLVSSLDPCLCNQNQPYFVNNPCNFPQVNYLLNMQLDSSYTCDGSTNSDITWEDWQRAIWDIINGDPTTCDCGAPTYDSDIVTCLVDDANAHSTWYPSSCTDVFAVILVPLPDCTCNATVVPTDAQSTMQEILIPMTLSQWGCACVTETEDEMAFAFDSSPCPTSVPRPCTDISPDGNTCIISKSGWEPYFQYCCSLVV